MERRWGIWVAVQLADHAHRRTRRGCALHKTRTATLSSSLTASAKLRIGPGTPKVRTSADPKLTRLCSLGTGVGGARALPPPTYADDDARARGPRGETTRVGHTPASELRHAPTQI